MKTEERNIILHLSYDGSAYHGWQTQKNGCTVQETLEHALSLVCGHPVKAVGCGRTDAGVHARHYCANFRTVCGIPADRVPLAVNARLPKDIAVREAWDGPKAFNAIGSCLKKECAHPRAVPAEQGLLLSAGAGSRSDALCCGGL